MENTEKTDKKILFKGIKTMIFALLSLIMGPLLMSMAFSNKDKPLYLPILIISVLICTMAVILMFRGINTIMSSMFKKK